MDLGQIHEIRRVSGMLERINRTLSKHTQNQLPNISNIQNELRTSERRLTLEAISNATPAEILSNASRLASLTRTR